MIPTNYATLNRNKPSMDLNVPYNKQLQMEMTIEYKEEPIKTQLVYKTDIKPVQENNKNHDIIIQSEKSERFIT